MNWKEQELNRQYRHQCEAEARRAEMVRHAHMNRAQQQNAAVDFDTRTLFSWGTQWLNRVFRSLRDTIQLQAVSGPSGETA